MRWLVAVAALVAGCSSSPVLGEDAQLEAGDYAVKLNYTQSERFLAGTASARSCGTDEVHDLNAYVYADEGLAESLRNWRGVWSNGAHTTPVAMDGSSARFPDPEDWHGALTFCPESERLVALRLVDGGGRTLLEDDLGAPYFVEPCRNDEAGPRTCYS